MSSVADPPAEVIQGQVGYPLGVMADVQETTIPPSAVIKVSKRAFQMFSKIFHTENQELPGEIPWTDFLHGFWSAGFSIEKQYGSAWVFTPPDTINDQSFFTSHIRKPKYRCVWPKTMDRDLRRRMGGQRKHLHRLVNVMWNETETIRVTCA